MSFLVFLLLGLVAGAIAKFILPGKQGGGWIATLILGVVGALLGGWLGGIILDKDLINGFSLESLITAVVGALIVLVIYGFVVGRKKA